MKKTIIIIAAALGLSAGAFAQDTFYPGFQWGVKGGVAYTIGETNEISRLLSPSAALNFGWQFSPLFTLRADLSGWQGKGFYSTSNPANPSNWTVQYGQLAVDAKFDIINMFAKQYRRHAVNPYLFAGLGAQYRFNNNATKEGLPYNNLLDDFKKFSYVGRLGAGIDFQVCKSTAIVLEFAENATDDSFNSKKGDFFDHQLYLHLGLNFSFGQACKQKAANAEKATAQKAAAASAAAASAAAAAAGKAATNSNTAATTAAAASAPAKTESAKPLVTSTDVATAAKFEENRIYFQIGKYTIQEKEAAKIKEVIKILKENPNSKVSVCGLADKETGTPKLNWALSQKRAQAVSKAIIDGGIAASRVDCSWKGDTESVADTPALNRVAVLVTK